ncbi:GTPase domain-containing protein [Jonesia quinghaiensis]|uniref:GTPase domain-containing protein n=1 Tax=Jonesia quinghaiensis TaxID=262806 RepID=UPI00040CA6AE|nr:GTPase domain-containing protein [Jonesia quinghaiensis]
MSARTDGLPEAPPPPTTLQDTVHDIERLLSQVTFPLDTIDAAPARDVTQRVRHQLDNYIAPRLSDEHAPLLTVVGGSTGAGKSTLINSMLGTHVTAASALRPTTRTPVLVCRPEDDAWFTYGAVLPGLGRAHVERSVEERPQPSTNPPAEPNHGPQLRIVTSERLPGGIALLDAPDIDSLVQANRAMATQLLDAADMWVFVTTAARYADAIPWDALRAAHARNVHVVIVLNRIDRGETSVLGDLTRLLEEHGMGHTPIIAVHEATLTDGFLSEEAIAPLSRHLTRTATTDHIRQHVIATTRDGSLEHLAAQLGDIAAALDTQLHVHRHLHDIVTAKFDSARHDVLDHLNNGAALRAEVLSSWQDIVGTGRFMRNIEQRMNATRDLVASMALRRGRSATVQEKATQSIATITLSAAQTAAHNTWFALYHDPAGQALTLRPELAHASPDLADHLGQHMRQWQDSLRELLLSTGGRRRTTARILAVGTNTLGAALIVVVFASTGGLTGTEITIAGGTALVAQRLLESVFGTEAVRQLASTAGKDLSDRITAVLAREEQRFLTPLTEYATPPNLPIQLRHAATTLRTTMARTSPTNTNKPSQTPHHPPGALRGATFSPPIDDHTTPTPTGHTEGGRFHRLLQQMRKIGGGER